MALRDHLTPEEYAAYRRGIVNKSQRGRRARSRDDQKANELRRRMHKRRLIEHLGGSCMRCGWKPRRQVEEAAFDFHHRNPAEKALNVAACLAFRFETLLAEIAKCDLLCARCHRIVEAEIDAA